MPPRVVGPGGREPALHQIQRLDHRVTGKVGCVQPLGELREVARPPAAPPADAPPPLSLTLDGRSVSAPPGAPILDACRAEGIDVPTMCFLANLTPVNVCRVCVVEVEGSRALVPACSRKVEEGLVVQTDSERVRTSRRLVLELLTSAGDPSPAGGFCRPASGPAPP